MNDKTPNLVPPAPAPSPPKPASPPPPSSPKQRGSLRELLSRKEVPFVLAALAAIFCWLVSHISSRLLDAPLIAFSEHIGKVRADGVQQRTYTIKNLTRTEVFKNLAFVID